MLCGLVCGVLNTSNSQEGLREPARDGLDNSSSDPPPTYEYRPPSPSQGKETFTKFGHAIVTSFWVRLIRNWLTFVVLCN